MGVICLNCEGWGCLQCKNERAAAQGGEQGLSPLEVEVEGLRKQLSDTQLALTAMTEALEDAQAGRPLRDGQGRHHAYMSAVEKLRMVKAELATARAERDRLLAEAAQAQANHDAWQKRAIAAETDSASWRQTAQEVVDLFDPLKGRWVTPGSLWAVATGAKTANRSLRDERDELLAQLALLRVPGGAA